MSHINSRMLDQLSQAQGVDRNTFLRDYLDEVRVKNAALILEVNDDPRLILSATRKIALAEVVQWRRDQSKPKHLRKASSSRPIVPRQIVQLTKVKIYDSIYSGEMKCEAVVCCSDGIVRQMIFSTRYKVVDMLQPPLQKVSLRWRSFYGELSDGEQPAGSGVSRETEDDEEREDAVRRDG